MIPDAYHVVWTSPSHDSSESMPCGGCDVGLNVWVEQGDILFYMDRSGSFDENNQMLKLGRIRLRLEPNPFAPGGEFRQELNLHEGCVYLSGSTHDAAQATVRIWAEIERPAVHVEITGDAPMQLSASYENWRTHEREIPVTPLGLRHPCSSYFGYPGKVITRPDVVEFSDNRVIFYHRNGAENLLVDRLIEQQGLSAVRDQIPSLQKDFTFGGCLSGDGMVAAGTTAGVYGPTPFAAWTLRSQAPRQRHDLDVCFHSVQVSSAQAWLDDLPRIAGDGSAEARQRARKCAMEWWQQFWHRSYIHIQPDHANPSNQPWQVGRNYQLFRYMLGCNARGEYPTKFNGGLFTFDPAGAIEDPSMAAETPDFRQWGGGSFTAQNQRLVYWPMLKSGDFDLMPSQFEFYRRGLSAAEARTRVYWGHGGCSFTEQLENCGLPIGWGWGWPDSPDPNHRRPRLFDPTEQVGPWIRYEYSTQLEFAWMILRYHQFTGRDIGEYWPFIHAAIRFYDEHYQYLHQLNTTQRLDADGRLVIFPSTALETYKDATNPADVVAGLRSLVETLLAMPSSELSAAAKEYYSGLLSRIPPLDFREINGRKTIAPARSWSGIINVEIPQLYPVFPYDLYRLGHDDLQVAIDTWHHGIDNADQRNHISWHQDNIFCARLGLTNEAAALAIKKLGDGDKRFPAFWGGGHDWTPDHNWGGSGMIGLQEMLMQTFDRQILLLPAWPKDWDVDFKLHAPYETTVEAGVRGGKLMKLIVTPPSRLADVVNMWDQQ